MNCVTQSNALLVQFCFITCIISIQDIVHNVQFKQTGRLGTTSLDSAYPY
jgi:hypothetical protein